MVFGSLTRRSGTAPGPIAAGAALAVAVVAVVGWQALSNDTAAPPERDRPRHNETVVTTPIGAASGSDNRSDWVTNDPLVDLVDLADVHAASRLQYDECQQGFADISADPSSSRNPLYFC